jgi:hypothetical protein
MTAACRVVHIRATKDGTMVQLVRLVSAGRCRSPNCGEQNISQEGACDMISQQFAPNRGGVVFTAIEYSSPDLPRLSHYLGLGTTLVGWASYVIASFPPLATHGEEPLFRVLEAKSRQWRRCAVENAPFAGQRSCPKLAVTNQARRPTNAPSDHDADPPYVAQVEALGLVAVGSPPVGGFEVAPGDKDTGMIGVGRCRVRVRTTFWPGEGTFPRDGRLFAARDWVAGQRLALEDQRVHLVVGL